MFKIVLGCNESTDTAYQNSSEEVSSEASEDKKGVEVDVEQTNEERIAQIKQFYKDVEASEKKACKTESRISYDSFDGEEQIPFEDFAEQCNYAIGFTRKSVELHGYEWADQATFYYEGDDLFFVYMSGGAEACAYEYRVYYDKRENPILVLSSENDCDGEDPGNSIEVKDEQKKEEIIETITYTLRQLNSILGEI